MEAVGQPQGDPLGEGLERVGRSPMLIIATGVVGIVVGVLALVLAKNVEVIAWLFAFQMIVTGVLQLIAAFAGDPGAAGRVLLGLLGALTILVGLLLLRAPLQTVTLLGMLIGATWVVEGVIGIFHAISDGLDNGRGWRIASGLISVVGGAAVLIYPVSSVAALTWLLGIVVLVAGVVLVVRGVFARRSTQPVDAVATSSR